ncbi:MAG: formate dehydrogenase accessory sulfurtransferase FdhD [Chloroflexota bacterium]|nr:formate dehydrogenase accessory sulfurtransferase FdhD [Chloroflexota bacterium]
MDKSGTAPARRYAYRQSWQPNETEVIEEASLIIYINGQELITLMCTPVNLDWLALGFLRNEGLIAGLEEVEEIHINPNGCCVELWLNHSFEKPERTIITTGCVGGVTFDDPSLGIEPLYDTLQVTPQSIQKTISNLQSKDSLYARSRGVHASGLMNPGENKLLAVAEDVGRHSSIDKVHGACLLEEIKTRGRILLTTGRISSEMLRKGAVMGCPIIASRTSPTSLSVEMAQAWNITLVGYVRNGGMQVYSYPERLGYNMT